MNGAPIPPAHGAPAQVIVPGWYATDSVKWLNRVVLADGPFSGHFETADYRLPDPSHSEGRRMTVLAVHSLLTSHEDRALIDPVPTTLHGVAWGGMGGVAGVAVSIDGGPGGLLSWVSRPVPMPGWRGGSPGRPSQGRTGCGCGRATAAARPSPSGRCGTSAASPTRASRAPRSRCGARGRSGSAGAAAPVVRRTAAARRSAAPDPPARTRRRRCVPRVRERRGTGRSRR